MPDDTEDRDGITEHANDVLTQRYRSCTIETILCRPVDAILFAADVGVRSGKIKDASARRIVKSINDFADENAKEFDAIFEILRTSLNARKRSALRKVKA